MRLTVTKFKFLMYTCVTAVMLFAATSYFGLSVSGNSSLTCCSFGQECFGLGKGGSDMQCCEPFGSQTDCSPSKKNYCKTPGSC